MFKVSFDSGSANHGTKRSCFNFFFFWFALKAVSKAFSARYLDGGVAPVTPQRAGVCRLLDLLDPAGSSEQWRLRLRFGSFEIGDLTEYDRATPVQALEGEASEPRDTAPVLPAHVKGDDPCFAPATHLFHCQTVESVGGFFFGSRPPSPRFHDLGTPT